MKRWKWFRHSIKFPDCIIYYDTNGIFDTLVGIPFIASGYDLDNELCIGLINPPNIKFRLGYKDFYKDEIVKKVTFSPLLTDSIGLVNINAYHKFQKEHKYMLYFLVVDSTHILSKSTTELINNADEKSNRVCNTDSFIAVDPPNISHGMRKTPAKYKNLRSN